MLSWPDVAARLRNRARRIAARVPHGAISPVVPDDVFQAHVALYDFFAAFTAGRRVLYRGGQAYGAVVISHAGAASVTALLRPRERRFARRRFAGETIGYPDALESHRRYDVAIRTDEPHRALEDAGVLADGGKLIVAMPPAGPADEVGAALRSRFASVRRFVQQSLAPVDLASPQQTTLTPDSFSFRELRYGAPVPADAATIVLVATDDPKWREPRLHIGCGPLSLPGWINMDNQPYAGVDMRWDVSRGIPIAGARFIFAEHFIEHLSYSQAVRFTAACRAALDDDGILRMSTPNLDWVWSVSYHPDQWTTSEDALRDCFVTNRAFRGWGHQFLHNAATLRALLRNAGFAEVTFHRYGESDTPELARLERHEPYPDDPSLPHVLVVEARGRREVTSIEGAELIAEYERDVAVR